MICFELRMQQKGKKNFVTGKQATCKIPQSFFEVEEHGRKVIPNLFDR